MIELQVEGKGGKRGGGSDWGVKNQGKRSRETR